MRLYSQKFGAKKCAKLIIKKKKMETVDGIEQPNDPEVRDQRSQAGLEPRLVPELSLT